MPSRVAQLKLIYKVFHSLVFVFCGLFLLSLIFNVLEMRLGGFFILDVDMFFILRYCLQII